ncbi:MAG TPA: PAS domain S-box protein [Phycisphaeraceae bacterium]
MTSALRATAGLIALALLMAGVTLLDTFGLALSSPSPLVLIAVVLATFYGGWAPGLATAALGELFVHQFLHEHGEEPGTLNAAEWYRLIQSGLASVLAIFVVQVLRSRLVTQERTTAARQEALAAARRYEDLVQGINAIIWEADAYTWQFHFVSRQAEKILGYPIQQWIQGGGSFFLSIVHPEDRQRVENICLAASQKGQDHDLEYRMITPTGRVIWIHDRVRVMKDYTGHPHTLFGVMVNVTAQHQIEEALRLTGARLEALFNHTSDAMLVYQPVDSAPLIEVNEAAVRLTGYPRQELLGKSIHDVLASVPGEASLSGHQTGNDDFCETMLIRRDGSRVAVEINSQRFDLNGHTTVLSICRDITQRKRAEEAQRHLAAIVQSSSDAIVSVNRDGILVSWNPAAEQIFGYTAQEAIGQPVQILAPLDRVDEVDEFIQRVREGQRIVQQETVRQRKDGSLIDISLTVSPILDAQGQIEGFSGIIHNITEQKRLMRRLKLQHAVTSILASTGTLEEAAPALLEAIRQSLDAQEGALWLVDESGQRLVHAGIVSSDQNEPVRRFAQESRRYTFTRGQDLPGRAWEMGRPVWVEDLRQAPDFPRRRLALEAGLRSGMAFPILSDGQFIGEMGFFTTQLLKPDPAILEMMATIGSEIGQFIQRRRAEQQIRQRVRQLEAITHLGQIALASRDIQGLLEETSKLVAGTLDNELAGVLEFLPQEQRLRVKAGVGLEEGLVDQVMDLAPPSVAGQALRTGKPVVVHDLSDQHTPVLPLLRRHGVQSGISVTIPGGQGQLYGVLNTFSTCRRWFTQDDVRFLQAAASVLAAAIQRQKTMEQLEQLNATLEQQVAERAAVAERRAAQLRVLSSELIRAEQRERRRLARTLHDHLQQLLVAAKLRVGLITSHPGANPELRESIRQIDDLLNQSIEASRSLTVELSPSILYDVGLRAALEWLARQMQQKHHLCVHVEARDEDEPPTEDLRVLLFLAAQELLFNVVKHAGVREAWVQLSRQNQHIQLVVEDHGKGFNTTDLNKQQPASSSFGLFSIQERTQLLQGQMEVESAPDRGTRVTLRVPLRAATEPAAVGSRVIAEDLEAARPASHKVSPHRAATNPQQRLIRVLLADDHKILREGLAGLLREQPDIDIVGQASDGLMVLDLAQRTEPDVIVMDVSMPRLSGVEATRRLIARMPHLRIVGLSMHDSADMAAAMRNAGAAAYLTKGGPFENLLAAIRGEPQPAEPLAQGQPSNGAG